ncbi:MAG: NUDIX domain-containing protein [Patescibacteria group bacterium]|nr:NUDIX domain-containing protein [Patescibacteria group bacterium]
MNQKDFHDDEENRIENERHAGIVIKDDKLLLIHRIKNQREYWVFPGGHRRQNEKGEEVVIREVEEETSLKVEDPKLIFEFKDYLNNKLDFYYLCQCFSDGEPELIGEEKVRNCQENFYEPLWMPLTAISSLNILPKFAKDWVIEYLCNEKK